MNKIVKVITASVLTVSMCGCAVSADEAKSTATADTVSAEKKSSKKDASEAYTSQQTGKDETVYVFTGADGSMNHMVVSDTLHTAGKKGAVEDYSNLDNIENVSGDEKYSSDDNGNITWTSDGSDISYQGTTDKELPVDVKITYYLNGNEVSPEEIKGQSGHVKVHFDYTNNAETTITSDGEEKTVKVPFGMVTGLTLDASKFTNVTVTNGKMNQYNDSDVIYGLALPGLKESLETASVSDIDLTSVNIPEYFEFEADTTDFDIDLCMTIATSNLLSLLNTDDLNVSDFSDSIDQLTSSGQKLVDGTKSLKDGTSQLKSGADSLDSGAQSLVNGIGTLNDGASSLNDGAASLASGAQSLNDGAKSVNDGASSLASGAQSLSDGANTVNDGANSLASGAQSLASGASQLDSGAASALSGAQQLESGLATLSGNSAALNRGYKTIYEGVNSLIDTVLKSYNITDASQLQNYTGVTDTTKQTALNAIVKNFVASSTPEHRAMLGDTDEAATKALIYLTAVSNLNVTSWTSSSLADAMTATAQTASGTLNTVNTLKREDAVTIINNNAATKAALTVMAVGKGISDPTDQDLVTMFSTLQSNVSAAATANQQPPINDDTAKVITALALENYTEDWNNDFATAFTNAATTASTTLTSAYTNFATAKAAGTATAESNKDLYDVVDNVLVSVVKSSEDASKSDSNLGQLQSLIAGLSTFKGSLKAYTAGVDTAYAGAQALVSGLSTLKDGTASLSSGASQLNDGASKLSAGTKSLADGAGTLLNGSNTLASGTQTLYNGTGSLLTGSNSLRDGAAELFSGVGKVKAGAQTLKNGTSSLKTGVVTLDEGAATLESGMEQFYEEGIKKIGDVLGKDLPAVVDSLKGLTNAGADYKTFSGALDDDNNSCKFIFKTEFDSDNK
ncbi:MAG: hypothetical protein LKE64_05280 [Solobacterium sp.]|jgi:putative membrane protein|nr:hypothetical protein [Solobacterium sp.]MCH4050256.1 hypothetical protein [Solobacterium sp.]MCH4073885.1 hypothetical protein [Solobacterium sp.]MCI1312830.1 hypothetical protein [Solobacterium sp.]MCI1345361.1 hypothetical protein [Solobacterium sp.]